MSKSLKPINDETPRNRRLLLYCGMAADNYPRMSTGRWCAEMHMWRIDHIAAEGFGIAEQQEHQPTMWCELRDSYDCLIADGSQS